MPISTTAGRVTEKILHSKAIKPAPIVGLDTNFCNRLEDFLKKTGAKIANYIHNEDWAGVYNKTTPFRTGAQMFLESCPIKRRTTKKGAIKKTTQISTKCSTKAAKEYDILKKADKLDPKYKKRGGRMKFIGEYCKGE